MNREFDQALLLYLDHCQQHREFVAHPLIESSEKMEGDWHLGDKQGLIAIVTQQGNVANLRSKRTVAIA